MAEHTGNAPVILVLGMHRSGSSALTRVLSLLGVELGEHLLEPMEGVNSEGFWESKRAVEVHERLLAELDTAWYDFRPLPDGWLESGPAERAREQLGTLMLSEFDPLTPAAVKDPRMCRLVPLWLRVLRDVRRPAMAVFPLRDAEAITASLLKRDGIVPGVSRRLWLASVLEAVRDTEGLPRVCAGFEELLTDWRQTAERIATALDLKWPRSIEDAGPDIDRFLRADLRHHQPTSSPTDPGARACATAMEAIRSADPANWDSALAGARAAHAEITLPGSPVAALAWETTEAFISRNIAYFELRAQTDAELYDADGRARDAQQDAEDSRRRAEEAEQLAAQLGTGVETLQTELRRVREDIDTARAERDDARADAQRARADAGASAELRHALEDTRAERDDALRARDEHAARASSLALELDELRASHSRTPIQRRAALRSSNTPADPVIDVIIPVYRGLDELRACVDSVLAGGGLGTVFELVLVDDRGPDDDVAGYLSELAERGPRGVHVLRNDRNLGFVASVNSGMRLHAGRDVILLNSDTETPAGWVERVTACARSRPEIATVSPFSNNATICSWPRFCEDNELPRGAALADIDAAFAAANPGKWAEVPTTVGYCMYIKRAAIDDVGLFDEETFGRGYGEENDFCMRARRNGWVHTLCADTFVYHKGKVSFGSTSNPRIDEAQRTLARLHPHYEPLVARHIREDPARALRLRASAALLARSGKPTVLFIGHTSGGGTQRHMDELAAWVAGSANTVSLRGSGERYVAVSLASDAQGDVVTFDVEREWNELIGLLRSLGVRRVHVHHTMGLPPRAWGLAEALGVPMDYTAHDYYSINANPTLTDAEARYCGDRPDRDELCAKRYPIPSGAPPDLWRSNHAGLLGQTDRVFAPSQAASDLLQQAFGGVNIVVADHPDREAFGPYPEPVAPAIGVRDPLRVCVIGALSREKGADVLEAAADLAVRRRLPIDFTLIGYAYKDLSPVIKTTGPYDDAALPELLAEHAPHLVWFPAQWPETYNYVLSRVLELGLPTAVPQIGSFPERVAGRPLTWALPWNSPPAAWLTLFDGDVRRGLVSPTPPRTPGVADAYREPAHPFRYASSYVPAGLGPGPDASWAKAAELVGKRRKRRLSSKELAALALAELKHGKYTRKLSGLIPEHMQKSIKARLTSRSSSELMTARARG